MEHHTREEKARKGEIHADHLKARHVPMHQAPNNGREKLKSAIMPSKGFGNLSMVGE